MTDGNMGKLNVFQGKRKRTGTGWWCNNHLEKYEFVNGKDYPHIFIMEKKHV